MCCESQTDQPIWVPLYGWSSFRTMCIVQSNICGMTNRILISSEWEHNLCAPILNETTKQNAKAKQTQLFRQPKTEKKNKNKMLIRSQPNSFRRTNSACDFYLVALVLAESSSLSRLPFNFRHGLLCCMELFKWKQKNNHVMPLLTAHTVRRMKRRMKRRTRIWSVSIFVYSMCTDERSEFYASFIPSRSFKRFVFVFIFKLFYPFRSEMHWQLQVLQTNVVAVQLALGPNGFHVQRVSLVNVSFAQLAQCTANRLRCKWNDTIRCCLNSTSV